MFMFAEVLVATVAAPVLQALPRKPGLTNEQSESSKSGGTDTGNQPYPV